MGEVSKLPASVDLSNWLEAVSLEVVERRLPAMVLMVLEQSFEFVTL